MLEEVGEVDDVQLGCSVPEALRKQAQKAAGKDGGDELTRQHRAAHCTKPNMIVRLRCD